MKVVLGVFACPFLSLLLQLFASCQTKKHLTKQKKSKTTLFPLLEDYLLTKDAQVCRNRVVPCLFSCKLRPVRKKLKSKSQIDCARLVCRVVTVGDKKNVI